MPARPPVRVRRVLHQTESWPRRPFPLRVYEHSRTPHWIAAQYGVLPCVAAYGVDNHLLAYTSLALTDVTRIRCQVIDRSP